MILAGVNLVMLILWLPETFAPVLLMQKVRDKTTAMGEHSWLSGSPPKRREPREER